jgi:hypothetical protein
MKIKNALVGCLVHSHKGRSDDKLIEAIAAGNEDAMRTLYARHHVRVYHFIVRLGFDTYSAEDIVSESSSPCGAKPARSQVSPGFCRSPDLRPLRRLDDGARPNSTRLRLRWSRTIPILPNKCFFTPTEPPNCGNVLRSCLRITAKSSTLSTIMISPSKRSQRYSTFRKTP